MTAPYHVITEPTGWSFIVDRDGNRDGPWRYRWEAEAAANEMNIQANHDRAKA